MSKDPEGADALTFEQWAEQACLLAHRTQADVIYAERNYGGGLVLAILRAAWEKLVKDGAIPGEAMPPSIQETVTRESSGPRYPQIVLGFTPRPDIPTA